MTDGDYETDFDVALQSIRSSVFNDVDWPINESPAPGSDRDSLADDVFAGFEELASELLTV